jgi:5,10-methylenetetrahydromethanopterin reductase
MDTQSIAGDPYVQLGAWAMVTKRLMLSTGVTNPLTRHPVVTAAAAATLQAISGGRAVLGIGRGDSALAHLGYGPVSLLTFRETLRSLQKLLRGDAVEFEFYERSAMAPSVGSLSLGGRPIASRLEWLAADMPKVPLDVAASGPKVIEMSAPLAERVTFSVGAIPERIAWALDLARGARKKEALDEAGISYGAQIIVVCHPDVEVVRQAAASFVAPLARFQVLQTAAAGPKTPSDEANYLAIMRGYDMTRHGEAISDKKVSGSALSWDFVERFAVVGPPDHCIERLLQLVALGIERFVIVGPGLHPEARPGQSLFVREVMPGVRAAISDS